jgi:hypothetical protein
MILGIYAAKELFTFSKKGTCPSLTSGHLCAHGEPEGGRFALPTNCISLSFFNMPCLFVLVGIGKAGEVVRFIPCHLFCFAGMFLIPFPFFLPDNQNAPESILTRLRGIAG